MREVLLQREQAEKTESKTDLDFKQYKAGKQASVKCGDQLSQPCRNVNIKKTHLSLPTYFCCYTCTASNHTLKITPDTLEADKTAFH